MCENQEDRDKELRIALREARFEADKYHQKLCFEIEHTKDLQRRVEALEKERVEFYHEFEKCATQNVPECRRCQDIRERSRLHAKLDGYENFTWPNGESEDAAQAAIRLQAEVERLQEKADTGGNH